MKLNKVASYFDTVVAADQYHLPTRIKGQLDLFDESKRDGVTVLRRTFSCASGTRIPTRRTLTFADKVWLVGNSHPDMFCNDVIRDRFVIQEARFCTRLQTAAEVLTDKGYALWCDRTWVADVKEYIHTDELQSRYVLAFSRCEPVVQDRFVCVDGLYYLLRNTYESAAGFLLAEANELEPDAIQDVQFLGQGAYDPITETHTAGAPLPLIKAIVTTAFDDYAHKFEYSAKAENGDIRLRVLRSALPLPQVGQKVTVRDELWNVLTFQRRDLSTWTLHLRRV